ncbi:MAG TPA: hypothetical protein VGY31_03390 [Terriglobia bacterium]|nr:hypothetical protein [Terriglobia bacterium]
MAEALLPGTDAITRGTIEWSAYQGKSLVRYRDVAGSVHRQAFKTADEAQPFFLECVNRLRVEAKEKWRQQCQQNSMW